MRNLSVSILFIGFTALGATATRPLSDFVARPSPWLSLEGDSEQGTPLFIGATPRDLVLGKAKASAPRIPHVLKGKGEAQFKRIAELLNRPTVQLETWPYPHWRGQSSWAVARWRADSQSPWQWLESSLWKAGPVEEPEMPVSYRNWIAAESSSIFTDFLQLKDLYDKPTFGHCIWTDEAGTVLAAWLPPVQSEAYRQRLNGKRAVCHSIHQVAWFNEKPLSLVVQVDRGSVTWPSPIQWTQGLPTTARAETAPAQVTQWPADYNARYQQDVKILTAETDAVFPISGKRARFTRKSSAETGHHLESLVDYLEERYQSLGIATSRQRFTWRGLPQSNLIAVLPGTLPASRDVPVLMADHIDTAFCEDIFEKTGRRVSTPGADDNSTAVAGLLRAAELFKTVPHARSIWLVHITGEEFPSDGLGTRHFLSQALASRRDFAGLVLMDMIGWRNAGDRVFQVNAGDSVESHRVAEVALGAAARVAPELHVRFRSRYDSESYLYNTDGILFTQMGYPVVLLNEHLNGKKMDHPHYHQSTDVTGNVDFSYAAAISRVAIETALRLSRN